MKSAQNLPELALGMALCLKIHAVISRSDVGYLHYSMRAPVTNDHYSRIVDS